MSGAARHSPRAGRLISGAVLSLITGCVVAMLLGAHVAHGASVTAPGTLDVLPFPGTPDASPRTQIDFPALAPSELEVVTVTGSRSGAHPGRLRTIANHGGTAFMPAHPFVSGDRVTVHARLGSPAAGTASGASGARQLSFSFTVLAPVNLPANAADSGDIPSSTEMHAMLEHSSLNPSTFTHTFHSEPSLHPPVVVVGNKDPDTNSGDIFTDAQRTLYGSAGPLILNPQGQPVWFDPLPNGSTAFNLSVQQYQGQSALTFFQGYVNDGYGVGDDVILNHSYQTVETVRAANGLHADLHEFQITPQGDALIGIYEPVHADLSSVGGSRNGMLLDCIIQEINIQTGQLVWEWHAYGHVHISESYAGKPGSKPYDFFHLNSIQQLPNGDFLVSARHTWAVYEINPQTGKIVWVLGGKHSNFKGSGTSFQWQHDARMQSDGMITLFDDADGYYKSARQSRGMLISLNMQTHQATLVHSYWHNPPVLSQSEGNLQVLPNNNVFVGFGSNPYFTEFSQTGRQLFTARFNYPVEFYRAYRFPWTGQPTGSPDIATSTTTTGTTVYASWNGATNVASWRVLAGATQSALTAVASKPFNGFETAIATTSSQPYYAVQALGSSGKVLGTSAVISR